MTYLGKNEEDMRKFRKADELYYLMKQIRRGQRGASDSLTYDD